ncbi:MAG: TrkH family potassium uptake protein [Treponemataceae bacterium]
MIFLSIIRIVSSLVAIIGSTYLFPISAALVCKEYHVILPFAIPMVCSWVIALSINLPCFILRKKIKMKLRSTFAAVALSWAVICIFGALPLYFTHSTANFTDAVFESVSGFSTTGMSVITNVETLPQSINLYRCQTHWLGGMGVVALTVALLPLLGVGGFQLIKAETTGPEKGKITSKITTTAKYLWLIYLIMTVFDIAALMFCGLDLLDAISIAFSTMGTGGFSVRNGSIAGFNSIGVNIVCTIFMFLSGVNFSMYFYMITGRFDEIKSNSEFKYYIVIFFLCVIFVTFCLKSYFGSFGNSLMVSSFTVASVITTTGFTCADYTVWPVSAQILILLLFFTGACSGSTAGGIKIVRWAILYKQFKNDIKKLLHPQGIFTIKLNGKVASKDIVPTVSSFIFLYIVLVIITTVIGCLAKFDILSSFSAAACFLGNIGIAFGKFASSPLDFVPPLVKWWYAFVMLAGRLELYTIIILFLPEYWRNR